jgi:hypothetical protein
MDIEELRSIRQQLDALGRKLKCPGPPGHCDYISKKDAGEWADNLASKLNDIIIKER